MADADSPKPDSIVEEAKEAFEAAVEHEKDNRTDALDDLKFGRLGEQWPEAIKNQREAEGRPCLSINTIPSSLRQVTNDARQNKPSMHVKPADSFADIHTAEVINGIIRNIEQMSNAGVAYDTAIDSAASMGWGYFRIAIEYAFDDTFDKDLLIQAIPNPFSVYGDPQSTKADSSDWNSAFVTEMMSKDEFKRRFKGARESDWDALGYDNLDENWIEKDQLLLAEWWRREEVTKEILKLSNGIVISAEEYQDNLEQFEPGGITVVASRKAPSMKVTHHLMTGAEVLETTPWVGRYIPIIPVYGEEVNVQGKRYWRSLFRDAKDSKRMENYHRSAVTELIALAPKTPFIGPEKAFTGRDAKKWDTANTQSYSYIAYGGEVSPKRQAYAGVPPGEMQEALTARQDQKDIMGIQDAGLGIRSNETSGKAIMARQREGDVATFHFQDNLNRAITHGGKVLIDLIPKVYTGDRMVRILGADGEVDNVRLQASPPLGLGQQRQAPQQRPMKGGKPDLSGVFDLGLGKFDLVVVAGPSNTTRREEAAEQMTQMIQAVPALGEIAGDLVIKNMDWPGAQEMSERVKAAISASRPGLIQDKDAAPVDPAMQAAMQQMSEQLQQMQQALVECQQQLQAAEADNQANMAKAANDQDKNTLEGRKIDIEAERIEIDKVVADTNNIVARTKLIQAEAQAVQSQAQGAAETAESQATTSALNVISEAAAMMAQAAQGMMACMQQMSQPKPQKRAVKLADGMWQTEDVPMANGGMQ